MTRREVSIVSMSFLDLLSCALGAVLFLDLMFSLSLRPGTATEHHPFVIVKARISPPEDQRVDVAGRSESVQQSLYRVRIEAKAEGNGRPLPPIVSQYRGVWESADGDAVWSFDRLTTADSSLEICCVWTFLREDVSFVVFVEETEKINAEHVEIEVTTARKRPNRLGVDRVSNDAAVHVSMPFNTQGEIAGLLESSLPPDRTPPPTAGTIETTPSTAAKSATSENPLNPP